MLLLSHSFMCMFWQICMELLTNPHKAFDMEPWRNNTSCKLSGLDRDTIRLKWLMTLYPFWFLTYNFNNVLKVLFLCMETTMEIRWPIILYINSPCQGSCWWILWWHLENPSVHHKLQLYHGEALWTIIYISVQGGWVVGGMGEGAQWPEI